MGQMALDPRSRRLLRNVGHGNHFSRNTGGSPVAKNQAHRMGDPTTSQMQFHLARHQQTFIDIMVKNIPDMP